MASVLSTSFKYIVLGNPGKITEIQKTRYKHLFGDLTVLYNYKIFEIDEKFS